MVRCGFVDPPKWPAEAQALREAGWLPASDVVCGLPLTWRTVRLWHEHRVIPRALTSRRFRLRGARGGTRTLWPPELRQLLLDASYFLPYVLMRRPWSANGRARRGSPWGRRYPALRLVTWLLGYDLDVSLVQAGWLDGLDHYGLSSRPCPSGFGRIRTRTKPG